jgi:cysteine-rich repeat protein
MICTIDDVCVGGACIGDSTICGDGVVETGCGEACDDGNTTSGDGCSSTCQPEFVCGSAPQLGCRRPVAPGKSKLALKDEPFDGGDSLSWKWTKGATTPKADFGSPTTTTDYLLCVYDEGRGVVTSAFAPAAQVCIDRPCWRETAGAFRYKNSNLTPDGIKLIVLKEGPVPGKAKIIVNARGANLRMGSLPMTQPVTVQLRNSDGACWEALYSAPAQKDGATQYQDKSD